MKAENESISTTTNEESPLKQQENLIPESPSLMPEGNPMQESLNPMQESNPSRLSLKILFLHHLQVQQRKLLTQSLD